MFNNWEGSIKINDTLYESYNLIDPKAITGPVDIVLFPKENTDRVKADAVESSKMPTGEVQITVKSYMTKPSTPSFMFMKNWNNDIPMPLRTMTGKKIKETPGMVCMELHGDITQEIIPVCMKCGRPITNPVSQYFGMGPECGGHNYTNPFSTEEELRESVRMYKERLRKITWTGWIPKSAVLNTEEIYETIDND